MEKILITGSNGNLGSQIVKELNKNKNNNVICWSRKDCDLRNLSVLEKKIKEINPEILINTAAYNKVDACEENLKEKSEAIILNILLVEKLAEICRNIKCKFINFSTNYVFKGKDSCYIEKDKTEAINFYGLTKEIGEKITLKKMEENLNGCIIRVSNLFGPKGSSKSAKINFFDKIYEESKKNSLLEINDNEICNFTHTRHIALQLSEMINSDSFFGVYHFCNNNPITPYKAAEIYFKKINKNVILKKVNIKDKKRLVKIPISATLKSTRIKPLSSVEEAIKIYIKEQKENGMFL